MSDEILLQCMLSNTKSQAYCLRLPYNSSAQGSTFFAMTELSTCGTTCQPTSTFQRLSTFKSSWLLVQAVDLVITWSVIHFNFPSNCQYHEYWSCCPTHVAVLCCFIVRFPSQANKQIDWLIDYIHSRCVLRDPRGLNLVGNLGGQWQTAFAKVQKETFRKYYLFM